MYALILFIFGFYTSLITKIIKKNPKKSNFSHSKCTSVKQISITNKNATIVTTNCLFKNDVYYLQ